MRGGLMEQLGTPRDVYQRPTTEFVADFVGASNRRVGTVLAAQGDGRYRVDLAGLGPVDAAGVDGMTAGRGVCAIVRPEAVRVGAQGEGWVTVPARVADVAYLGPHLSCVVETPGGAIVTLTASADERLEPGDQCEVGWPHEAMWVLPLDPSAAAEIEEAVDPVKP
jgi:ABC-type Fe3+/spermidine/putrescine transport system ATPase subunit